MNAYVGIRLLANADVSNWMQTVAVVYY